MDSASDTNNNPPANSPLPTNHLYLTDLEGRLRNQFALLEDRERAITQELQFLKEQHVLHSQELNQQFQASLRQSSLNQPSPSLARFTAPSVVLPTFGGARADYRNFRNQLRFIFLTHPEMFPTDALKIFAIGSNLKGNALHWFTPYLEHPGMEPYLTHLSSLSDFLRAMDVVFGEIDLVKTTEHKLLKLRQQNRHASDYASEFRALASQLSWNDASLLALFEQGLSPEISQLFLSAAPPTSLDESCALAIRCSNRLASLQKSQTLRPSTNHRPFSPALVTFDPQRMDIDATATATHFASRPFGPARSRGPLTPAERAFRISNNLCIVCGASGHLRATCPLARPLPSVPTTLASVDATATATHSVIRAMTPGAPVAPTTSSTSSTPFHHG